MWSSHIRGSNECQYGGEKAVLQERTIDHDDREPKTVVPTSRYTLASSCSNAGLAGEWEENWGFFRSQSLQVGRKRPSLERGQRGIAGQDTGIGVAGAGRVSVRINGEWPGVTEKKTYCCHLTPLGMHIVIVSRVLRHRLLLVNWGSRGVHGGCGGP